MKTVYTCVCLFLTLSLCAQNAYLTPEFDKAEYLELLRISARQLDTPWTDMKVPLPKEYSLKYRSPTVGLENKWDLWLASKPVAVISIRGTTAGSVSWLENFYSAMVPATGQLTLASDFVFSYQLAQNPKAAVHAGWLIGMAYLSRDMVPKIDSCYKKLGIKEFIIMGHSQGAGIAFLLNAYVASLQKQQKLPADIRFKTYCSAAPKPGNLYFAYDYEARNQDATGNWSYTVINSADWVPQTPLTVQIVDDFNKTNPFTNARDIIGKQKLPIRWALNYAYAQMDKPARKTLRRYKKYLGTIAYKSVHKTLPEYEEPAYFNSSDYVRTGIPIVLLADDTYYAKYPDSQEKIFIHHFMEPYIYLTERLK